MRAPYSKDDELSGGGSAGQPRGFSRAALLPIFMIVFVDVLGMGITIPVMPLYAKEQLGANEVAVGAIVSLYFLAQMVGAPLLGRTSDRVGRRPVLIISQFGTLIALLMSGLAPALWVLFAARLIDGFTGGNVSTAQAYLSDMTDEKDRARGLGLMHAAFGLGFVLGPATGGLLGGAFGYRVPFFAAAAVCALSIGLTAWMLPESLPQSQRTDARSPSSAPTKGLWNATADLATTPGVLAFWVIGFAGSFAMMGYHSMFVLWSEQTVFAGLPAEEIQKQTGIIFTVLGCVGIATQTMVIGPSVRLLGERWMVVVGYVLRSVAWGGLILTHNYYAVLALLSLSSVAGGVAQPAMTALLTFAVPKSRRGFAIGAQGAVQGAGRVVGPLTTGLLFQSVGPASVMVATVVANSLAWLGTLRLLSLERRPED